MFAHVMMVRRFMTTTTHPLPHPHPPRTCAGKKRGKRLNPYRFGSARNQTEEEAKAMLESSQDMAGRGTSSTQRKSEGGTSSGTAEDAGTDSVAMPSPPRRNATPYNLFRRSRYDEVKEASPHLSYSELCAALRSEWNSLDGEAREPFEAEAAADKERYLAELKVTPSVLRCHSGITQRRRRIHDFCV